MNQRDKVEPSRELRAVMLRSLKISNEFRQLVMRRKGEKVKSTGRNEDLKKRQEGEMM